MTRILRSIFVLLLLCVEVHSGQIITLVDRIFGDPANSNGLPGSLMDDDLEWGRPGTAIYDVPHNGVLDEVQLVVFADKAGSLTPISTVDDLDQSTYRISRFH